MKDFDRDAASRPVSIPAQVDAPNDSDSEATRDIPPASVEDRSAKDRGRQDVVGSITDSDPSRALSTRVEGSACFEPPRVLATTLHLKRPRTGVVLPARPKAPIVDEVARQVPALSERPGLPARGGDAPDGGGERTQNALSEPAAKNPPHSGATAAAPNATPSGETEPARGRAGSKMAFPASAIPLPADFARAADRRRSGHPVEPFARDLAELAREGTWPPLRAVVSARGALSGRSR